MSTQDDSAGLPDGEVDESGAVAGDVDSESVDTANAEAADSGDTGTDETASPAEEEELDPVEEMRAALRRAPGDWYVVHSYAGYENKVKANLETRVQTLDVEDYIFQVEVPTEEVTEIKNGQRKQVQRKVLPGYILVRMDLNDQSWGAVRNTPGVTGFVGATSKPSPLTHDEVIKFLLPRVEPKQAAAGGKTADAGADPARRRSRSTSRSASRSPSWTARSPRSRPRSTRSTWTHRSSRCWCPSSAARPQSSWRSARFPRSRRNDEMPPKKRKLSAIIKLQIKAGAATPAPPVGPALGQHGVNIMEFCKAYNAATQSQAGDVVPVEISVFEDRSFTFELKTPPAARLLLKAAGVEKGSGEPHKTKVAAITMDQVRQIAQTKMRDLNANDIDAAAKIIAGTARSMGITIKG